MSSCHTAGARLRLLTRLAVAKGRIVPHGTLALAVYGDAGPDDAEGVLRVMLCKLRKTLPEGAIRTHRGVGYSLDPAVAATLQGVDDRLLVPADGPTGLEYRGG